MWENGWMLDPATIYGCEIEIPAIILISNIIIPFGLGF